MNFLRYVTVFVFGMVYASLWWWAAMPNCFLGDVADNDPALRAAADGSKLLLLLASLILIALWIAGLGGMFEASQIASDDDDDNSEGSTE